MQFSEHVCVFYKSEMQDKVTLCFRPAVQLGEATVFLVISAVTTTSFYIFNLIFDDAKIGLKICHMITVDTAGSFSSCFCLFIV